MSLPIMQYLHSGDAIRWLDPSSGQVVGPAAITGFGVAGMNADGSMESFVMITPLNGVEAVAPITIVSRIAALDGSTMRFHAGVPM